MKQAKPALAKGTRDYGPNEMAKRKFVFQEIEKTFRKYGFMPLETPAVENLQTLTGKYGDEGDRLIFKIINSGNFLDGLAVADFEEGMVSNGRALLPKICEKALRYDLTVPLARYVVMNQHQLNFPFKRYQMQPVWRADRPQKGRYREFYQCDADILGSDSLLNEVDLVRIYIDAFEALGLPEITVRINHRLLLQAIANWVAPTLSAEKFIIILDKLDKIGTDGVLNELQLPAKDQSKLLEFLHFIEKLPTTFDFKFIQDWLQSKLPINDNLTKGLQDLAAIFDFLERDENYHKKAKFDLTLARGLDYYTGTVFEVTTNIVSIGSLGGGGRYDNLTGIFGGPPITGVGISFGLERIVDVLNTLNRFSDTKPSDTKVLAIGLDFDCFLAADNICKTLRKLNVAAEVYPDFKAKMKKQLGYANDKAIPFALIIGENELKDNLFTLKNLETGNQETLSIAELLTILIEKNA